MRRGGRVGAFMDLAFGVVHFEEVKAALGGEGMRGVGVFANEAAEGGLEVFWIAVGGKFPTRDLGEPLGFLFVRGVGKIAKKGKQATPGRIVATEPTLS